MDDLQAEQQYKQATITSLRLLAASPKSGQELQKKLAEKGYPEAIIHRALQNLKEQGLLDDSLFAQDLVSRLTHLKAAGKHKVAFELKRHGVPEKIRREILETISPEDEFERAFEQGKTKWGSWIRLELQKRKKRLYDFLIRKGYDFQIAQDVLQKLLKEPLDEKL